MVFGMLANIITTTSHICSNAHTNKYKCKCKYNYRYKYKYKLQQALGSVLCNGFWNAGQHHHHNFEIKSVKAHGGAWGKMILTIDKMMTVVMNWLSQSIRWWQWWGCWWSPHNFVQAHERTRCQMMIIYHQIETNGHILIVGIRLGLYFSIYWEQWLIIIHWPPTIIRLERHFPWLW